MDAFVKNWSAGFILFGCLTTTVVYAVETVSDEKLANTASQNTIVSDLTETNKTNFLIEEDLLKREMPAYQSIKLLNIQYPNSFEKVTATQKENSTQDFGSESYSYRWAGNYQDIYDVNKSGQVFFNQQSGYYELSNVRGLVRVNVDTY
ncbi:hypothetical protein GCM10023206_25410 [Acinetobacter puyangensis]|uniref:Uncharacterized protein n=1 Tax=Acinetobacter puyangensis TaxID=1096779 RepID=A0A240E585_9GAMM|nr:hypothetical protein [Acinetobacter puyangensis]SNX43691.1 hypothetical protein SAMN05421731_101733 [Acinetobacter puyangensis]